MNTLVYELIVLAIFSIFLLTENISISLYINIPSSYNNICEATKVLTEEWNRRQCNNDFLDCQNIVSKQEFQEKGK